MDLLKYCEGCFGDEPPDICELYRHRFVLLHHLCPSTYRLVKQIVEKNGGTFHYVSGKRWGFETTKENHQHILNMLNICSVPVHTLEEHVCNLEARYDSKSLKLGKQCYLDLTEGDEWYILNPQTRSWCEIIPFCGGMLVREGSVLRCDLKGDIKFYWFKGLGEDSSPKILELQKRAAWNIAARYFEPRPVYWIEHKELGVGAITSASLGGLPDDIFAALVKFRPFEKHIHGLFIFESEDYELAKKVLGYINARTIKSTNVVILPGDPDKLHGTPVISLSETPIDRIDSFKTILATIAGDEVRLGDNSIEVPSSGGNFKVVFVGRSKGCAIGKTFYVPLNAIEDTRRIFKLVAAIGECFKMNVDVVEKLFVLNWSAKNEADTSFMLEAFIRNIDDPEFVQKLMTLPENRNLVCQWHEGVTKDYVKTSVPLQVLKKIGKHLAAWPNLNIERKEHH